MKSLLLSCFLLFGFQSFSQQLPWYFNTISFRTWAKEKDVHILALKEESSDLKKTYGGFSHFSTCQYKSYDSIPEFVELKTNYALFYLDKGGFVDSVKYYSCELQYPYQGLTDMEETDTHFYQLLFEIVKSQKFPDKIITRTEPYQVETTVYKFKPLHEDTSFICSGGQGIMDKCGAIFRESGTMHIDTTTGLPFNYDINLIQVLKLENNQFHSLINYNYRGDFYNAIINTLSYIPINDSTAQLQFKGTAQNGYLPQPFDTVMALPFYTISKNDTIISSSLSVQFDRTKTISIDHLFTKKQSQPEVIEHQLDIFVGQLPKHYSSDYDYHQFYIKENDVLQKLYGSSCLNHLLYRSNKYYLSTEIQKKRNGNFTIKHSFYDTITETWVPLLTEKYNKKNQLVDIQTTQNTMLSDAYLAFGNRSDLGFLFLCRNTPNKDTEISYESNSNLSISNKIALSDDSISMPFLSFKNSIGWGNLNDIIFNDISNSTTSGILYVVK